MYGFCNAWVCVCMLDFAVCGCVCVGFLMRGCVYVWVLQCVGVCVCMGFVMCGCVYVWVL